MGGRGGRGQPVGPLSRTGLRVRVGASVGVVVMVLLGTVVGDDKWWPFSPMSQYAFTVRNDGQINSFLMEGDRLDGTSGQVALSKEGIGLERSEMEGSMQRIIRHPSMMQTIAVLQSRRQPELSPLVRVRLFNRQTDLTGDRETRIIPLASWEVIDPEDPERGLEQLREDPEWPGP